MESCRCNEKRQELGMDEVIRSFIVERRLLLSRGFDHLARLWRFVLAFTPCALFLCEIVGDTLDTCGANLYVPRA